MPSGRAARNAAASSVAPICLHHGPLADVDQPFGNGVLLWFEVADFQAVVDQVRATRAFVVRDVHTNPNARQQEIWVRDPDGYLVVLAGPSEYRPRHGGNQMTAGNK